MAACAKLKMPVVVYTTTMPVAYSADSAPIANPVKSAVPTLSAVNPGRFGAWRPARTAKDCESDEHEGGEPDRGSQHG